MRPKLFEGVRSTVHTQSRAKKMQEAVTAFVERVQMDVTELSVVLGFSPSGVRKYLRDLQDENIVELHEAGCQGKGTRSVYRVIDNSEHIQNFLNRLAEMSQTPIGSKPRPKAKSPATLLSAKRALKIIKEVKPEVYIRHTHILSDDASTGIRYQKNEGDGKRDFMVAALFGPARTANA